MTRRRCVVIGSLLLMPLLAGGCGGVRPEPGTAAVVLAVGAEPKSGVKQGFTRVPVYDAAPQPPAAPAGDYERVDYSSLGDVIVWLEPAPPGARRPAPLSLTIDARNPSEAVRPASVGQEIVFRNGGTEPVSLYSVADENDFDFPPITPGGEVRYTVRAPGLIEVLADPSQPPVALVYAVPSPWVAATRSGKTVVFNGVTPGTYQALSWHPRLPGATAGLILFPGWVTRATLAVGVNRLAPDRP